jgi:hypothetical protein
MPHIMEEWEMSLLRWDDCDDYEPGFFIGSTGDEGEHLRHTLGWPYSVFRRAIAIGRTDIVICHGIQCLNDAKEIKERLDCLA